MKKIIPVISLCVAILTAAVSIIGVITISVAVSVKAIALIAIPVVIVGLVMSLLSVPINFIFKKDRLCFIAMTINSASLVLSIAATVVWLAAV